MLFVCLRHGAEEAEPEVSERPKRQAAFRGSGYRLGETEEEPSELIHGGPVASAPKKVMLGFIMLLHCLR